MARDDLSPRAKLVAIALDMMRNPKTGQCNPTLKTLMTATGTQSKTRLHAALEELISAGAIERIKKGNRQNFILPWNKKEVPHTEQGVPHTEPVYIMNEKEKEKEKEKQKEKPRARKDDLRIELEAYWTNGYGYGEGAYPAAEFDRLRADFGDAMVGRWCKEIHLHRTITGDPLRYIRTVLTEEKRKPPPVPKKENSTAEYHERVMELLRKKQTRRKEREKGQLCHN